MSTIPLNPSESTRRKNPQLYPQSIGESAFAVFPHSNPSKKRMRQSSKPLMNKLEMQFERYITALYPNYDIHAQAITFRLANGLRYTPDFVSFYPSIAWEVKGKWVDGDSFPKLKMAAALYPEVVWNLVWLKDGIWQEQKILP